MKNYSYIIILLSIFTLSFTSNNTHLVTHWNSLLDQTNFDKTKQSFCVEENGKIFGKNLDLKVKPASVTKLYTTLWSLDELGRNFRFQTKLIVKNNNLYIVGGSDPFFVTENLFILMSELAANGYTSFDKVYFSADFFLNWSESKEQISSLLMNTFNTSRWRSSTLKAFNNMNKFIVRNNLGNEITLPFFSVKKVIPIQNIRMMSADYSFFFKSSPIWQHLKQVNMYSNNFYTDKIFDFLGGSEKFADYIYRKISATTSDVYLYTGSGLGNNYTTCRTTINMLNALEEVLEAQGLKFEDVIAIPGADNGTLKNRFTENNYTRALAAKTGTLRDTSTLAGYLFSKDSIKFGVFNSTTNKQTARNIQDKLIKKSIDNYTNIQQITYQTPDYISIKDIEIIDN